MSEEAKQLLAMVEAGECYGAPDGFKIIGSEEDTSGRWQVHESFVVQSELTGKYFGYTVSWGATEMQEHEYPTEVYELDMVEEEVITQKFTTANGGSWLTKIV